MIPPILHLDDRLIVLDKPTSLLSVPGIGPEKADCLASRVQAVHPEARIVHRLDRDTSGVIVMARDAEAHRELSRQFHDREIEKTYHALVADRPEAESGVVELPLRKDLENTPLQIVDHVHGKPSLTHWRRTSHGVVGDLDAGLASPDADATLPISRIELEPKTGRSHQLRVHLRELGHPILGDDLYAPDPWRICVVRLCLHASRLWLVHPSTGAPMTFQSTPPF